MIKTTITWYKPEEKTPKNGEVLALSASGHITTLSVYDGHFNCSNRDRKNEIEVVLWAHAPRRLKSIAIDAWLEMIKKLSTTTSTR